jgi:hypothetical protein
MALDQTRNDQNVESMRAQWLEARVDLATARVNLQNALRDVERNRRLRADKIVSDAEFELAQSLADALTVEVQERTAVVESLESSVTRLPLPLQLSKYFLRFDFSPMLRVYSFETTKGCSPTSSLKTCCSVGSSQVNLTLLSIFFSPMYSVSIVPT